MNLYRELVGHLAYGRVVRRRRRDADVSGLVAMLRREAPRPLAAQALGELRANEAVSTLVAMLRMTDLSERAAVAAALGAIGTTTEPVVSALADALGDGDRAVQTAAACALVELGDPLDLRPPLAAHEREVVVCVERVVCELVDAGAASLEVIASSGAEPHGPPPPRIEVRPTLATPCPITVQIDHWKQVSLFMGPPTWCETWHNDRGAYLDWIGTAVRAVVGGRYEEWVKPDTGQARGRFHLDDGAHDFTDNMPRGSIDGFEHRVYTSYLGHRAQ